MNLLILSTISTAILVGSVNAAPPDNKDSVETRIRRVETGLPSVKKDDRVLDHSLTGWMEALGIPGVSIAVIDDYRVVWAKGYGVMDAGVPEMPVTETTLFQAASIAKPFAALALLHYTEQGTYDLDTDVNSYLKSWKLPSSNRVTLRRLLAHTAGITPGGFAGYERDAALPGIVQILDGQAPATNRPARVVSAVDSAVSYSGLGYTMIALALIDQLGKPFEKIIGETIFQPIGMHNSTFEQVLPDSLAARAARGHRSTGTTISNGWYVYPELAAAGLWTTPTDLALMAIEVANAKSGRSHQVLSRDMTRQMLTQQKDRMGLGFVVRPEDKYGYFAHSGGNQGYRAHFEMLADAGQGVVVMTNSDAGQLLVTLLIRSVAQVYGWPSQPTPVSVALSDAIFTQVDRDTTDRTILEVDEHILARYVGRYELAPGLEFEVTLADGQLSVRLGDQPSFPVYPESESKFFFKVVDAQITFVENAAGDIVSLVLHQGGRDQEAGRIR